MFNSSPVKRLRTVKLSNKRACGLRVPTDSTLHQGLLLAGPLFLNRLQNGTDSQLKPHCVSVSFCDQFNSKFGIGTCWISSLPSSYAFWQLSEIRVRREIILAYYSYVQSLLFFGIMALRKLSSRL